MRFNGQSFLWIFLLCSHPVIWFSAIYSHLDVFKCPFCIYHMMRSVDWVETTQFIPPLLLFLHCISSLYTCYYVWVHRQLFLFGKAYRYIFLLFHLLSIPLFFLATYMKLCWAQWLTKTYMWTPSSVTKAGNIKPKINEKSFIYLQNRIQ